MNSETYRVHIIVDPLYADRLCELPPGEPVWVVDSEANHPVIQRLLAGRKAGSHVDGITSFKFALTDSPEDILLGELATIDLHHGEYSHNPPYSVLHVIGANCSETVKESLREYGFTEYEQTEDGFKAMKR